VVFKKHEYETYLCMPVIPTLMDSLTLILCSALICITGLVGIAIWLSNQRALEKMREESLNYRAELRAGLTAPQEGEEPDMMQTILTLAMQNPELVQKFLSATGNQQQSIGSTGIIPGLPPEK